MADVTALGLSFQDSDTAYPGRGNLNWTKVPDSWSIRRVGSKSAVLRSGQEGESSHVPFLYVQVTYVSGLQGGGGGFLYRSTPFSLRVPKATDKGPTLTCVINSVFGLGEVLGSFPCQSPTLPGQLRVR